MFSGERTAPEFKADGMERVLPFSFSSEHRIVLHYAPVGPAVFHVRGHDELFVSPCRARSTVRPCWISRERRRRAGQDARTQRRRTLFVPGSV